MVQGVKPVATCGMLSTYYQQPPGLVGSTPQLLDSYMGKGIISLWYTCFLFLPFSLRPHCVDKLQKLEVSDHPGWKALPFYLIEEIINRLENARNIALAGCVCKSFYNAAERVQSIRIICLNEYHDRVRAERQVPASTSTSTSNPNPNPNPNEKADSSAAASPSSSSSHAVNNKRLAVTTTTTTTTNNNNNGETRRRACVPFVPLASRESRPLMFRDVVVKVLKNKPCLVQLRIEIEPRLQSKQVPDGERRRTDHWLGDQLYLKQWIPSVKDTLQHLCIIDYAQQAIMRRTQILKLLSLHCPLLKTLDLRNMFIDTQDLLEMPKMESLTMRCVKVTGAALQDINDRMQNLLTLALLGVFGVGSADLTFPNMKVLCLGLSTVAKKVKVCLPNLVKLQLKMHCPEELSLKTPSLQFIAFNLEVQDEEKVELRDISSLQEVLYGASKFVTLGKLISTSPNLNKIFLDIPCMALGEDGRWLGVIKDVDLNLPMFAQLHVCEKLEALNIGPGLWHSMEMNLEELARVDKWPAVKKLIVHMIPQSLDTCLMILRILLRPTLTSLDINVHTNSPVDYEVIVLSVKDIVTSYGPCFTFKTKSWTKSLDFSNFSF